MTMYKKTKKIMHVYRNAFLWFKTLCYLPMQAYVLLFKELSKPFRNYANVYLATRFNEFRVDTTDIVTTDMYVQVGVKIFLD